MNNYEQLQEKLNIQFKAVSRFKDVLNSSLLLKPRSS